MYFSVNAEGGKPGWSRHWQSWIIVGLFCCLGCEEPPIAQPADKNAAESVSTEPKAQQPADNASISKQEVVPIPALPELPEFSWNETRQFNLPLNNPPIVGADEAYFLKPDDIVLGVLLGDSARAYPWFMMANYHAVNDHINRKPVIVTLCEACNGGSAFMAYAGDTPLDFRPRGLKHGTWYAVDFQTGSLWHPFRGVAFKGPLKGTRLERIRSYFTTWRNWVKEHPHSTVVVTSDEVRKRPHGRNSRIAARSTMQKKFLHRIGSLKPHPKRDLLVDYELVYGLIPSGDAKPKAYVIQQFEQYGLPIQTTIGDVPVLLLLQNQYQVGAYVRRHKGKELHLQVHSRKPLLLADQDGNIWNAWGRTESGPDHRSELPVADGYLAKWYEWLENFPETDLITLDQP